MMDTTNIDMAAESAARGGKTDLEMENVHLRRKLMEAEDKAFRVAGRAALIMRERDGLSGEVQRLLREKADLMGRAGLGERERRILDMWPRFEDGEYADIGDVVNEVNVRSIVFSAQGVLLSDCTSVPGWGTWVSYKEPLKRPVPEVVDADGVPIHDGDEAWHIDSGERCTVTRVESEGSVSVEYEPDRDGCRHTGTVMPCKLIHKRPDSWERLEEDAAKIACDYFGVECDSEERCRSCPHFRDGRDCSLEMNADIVRRAKKLAGVE